MKRLFILMCLVAALFSLKAQTYVTGESVESEWSSKVGNLNIAPPSSSGPLFCSGPIPGTMIEVEYADPENWGYSEIKALVYALRIWEEAGWPVGEIKIQVSFDEGLPSSSYAATVPYLASNFPSFVGKMSNTLYPTSLMKRMCQEWSTPYVPPVSETPDITIKFNGNKSLWYFGTDRNTPSDKYDFVTAVLRELAKGWGFLSSVHASGSNVNYLSKGLPYIYDHFVRGSKYSLPEYAPKSVELKNFVQSGNVTFDNRYNLYAPPVYEPEISINYFDTTAYNQPSKMLMAPYLRLGDAIHKAGSDVYGVLIELGWEANNIPTGPNSLVSNSIVLQTNVDTITYNQPYVFTSSYQTGQLFDGIVIEDGNEWNLEILTEDGENYSYPLADEEYNEITVNISTLPNGYDWLRGRNGFVSARIHLTTPYLRFTPSFQFYECDTYFHFQIPCKPNKPKIRIKEIIEGSWSNDVIFEYFGDGATSFTLSHEIEGLSGITYDVLSAENNVYRMNYIDPDVENYFILKAINKYGQTVGDVFVYGGYNYEKSSMTMHTQSRYDDLILNFTNENGATLSTELQEVKIANIMYPMYSKKEKNYQSGEAINVSNLPSGIYVVNAMDKKGNVYTSKFSKKY